MTNRILIILIFISFFKWCNVSFAGENTADPREAAIDRAIGGMVEGSRPLAPQGYAGKNQIHKVPGANLSPGMDAQGPSTSNGIGSSVSNAGGAESGTLEGGTTTPETESTSGGSTSDSIVNVDANVDLSGGTPAVDANLEVDTNAQGGLLDANAAGTTDVASTEVAVVESGQIAGEDLTTVVENAPVDAVLDTEIVSTDVPADSEAAAGLEATVDPVTADTTPTDPADGLVL